MGRLGFSSLFALLAAVFAGPVSAQVVVDKNLPSYKTAQGVAGTLTSIGSDTMNTVMQKWAEGFCKAYPNVKPQIEEPGTSKAIPGLIAGTSNFGPMSRKPKQEEIDEFKKKFGYEPTALPVCLDMLVIYVNKDCPIDKLSYEEADAIFSKSRKRGHKKEITTWGDLGAKGDWAAKPIAIYGRNSASGTYDYFKKEILDGGDFKAEMKEQPGSAGVVQAVGGDKFGIGFSGIGYISSDVKAVALAKKEGQYIEASAANGAALKYPMSRALYLAVNREPGKPLDPLRVEFLKFCLSKEGQSLAVEAGQLPLPKNAIDKTLAEVGLKQ